MGGPEVGSMRRFDMSLAHLLRGEVEGPRGIGQGMAILKSKQISPYSMEWLETCGCCLYHFSLAMFVPIPPTPKSTSLSRQDDVPFVFSRQIICLCHLISGTSKFVTQMLSICFVYSHLQLSNALKSCIWRRNDEGISSNKQQMNHPTHLTTIHSPRPSRRSYPTWGSIPQESEQAHRISEYRSRTETASMVTSIPPWKTVCITAVIDYRWMMKRWRDNLGGGLHDGWINSGRCWVPNGSRQWS